MKALSIGGRILITVAAFVLAAELSGGSTGSPAIGLAVFAPVALAMWWPRVWLRHGLLAGGCGAAAGLAVVYLASASLTLFNDLGKDALVYGETVATAPFVGTGVTYLLLRRLRTVA